MSFSIKAVKSRAGSYLAMDIHKVWICTWPWLFVSQKMPESVFQHEEENTHISLKVDAQVHNNSSSDLWIKSCTDMHKSTANLTHRKNILRETILKNAQRDLFHYDFTYYAMYSSLYLNIQESINGSSVWILKAQSYTFFPSFYPRLPPLTVTHKAIHSTAFLIQPQWSPEVPWNPPYCLELTYEI